MIQLTSEDLTDASLMHLASIQNEIDLIPTLAGKVIRASSKWKSKRATSNAKSTFDEIKGKLIKMCSGVEICVYCEHNEATDIEHIYPKRIYPNKCFQWGNYVLVCGKCNTHFKKENFKIFSPQGSINILDITPKRKEYIDPENEDSLFINQRIEDPFEFLELDFLGKTFYFIEKSASGTREYAKAKFTKDVLGLNTREDIVRQRVAAFKFFKTELQRYCLIERTAGVSELLPLIDRLIDVFNEMGDFESEKEAVLKAIVKRIKNHNHPSVWKEMIRQRENLPETNQLFEQVPDALSW